MKRQRPPLSPAELQTIAREYVSCDLDELARRLGMTRRSLQRKASDLGVAKRNQPLRTVYPSTLQRALAARPAVQVVVSGWRCGA